MDSKDDNAVGLSSVLMIVIGIVSIICLHMTMAKQLAC